MNVLMLMTNLIPIVIYLAFVIPSLYSLRRRNLDDMAQVLWAAMIVLVPILGPITFGIVQPGREKL